MPTKTYKPWWQSKTVWGGLIAVLPSLGIVGFNIDLDTGDFNGNIYTLWPQLVSIGGGVLAIWGRATASLKLK